jgi:hypothetical protein
MKVYVFTSETLTNIWAGVGAQMWAVPLSSSASSNKGRATKASKMPVGAFGILYCSHNKCFTSPFIVHSKVELNTIIEHIWPGKWILPFSIRTIGNPHAALGWTDVSKQLPSCADGAPLNRILHVEPLTVFTGDDILNEDWSFLVEKLAN